MTYAFMVIGLFALWFNQGRKREFCAVYLAGLVVEELVDYAYAKYIHREWIYYYGLIAIVDIATVRFMYRFFHEDFFLVGCILFLMFLVNAMIVYEEDTTGTAFTYAVRLDMLHPLNALVLVLLFGAGNGFKRILNNIRYARDALRRAYYARGIWAGNSLSYVQNTGSHKGKKECSTQ